MKQVIQNIRSGKLSIEDVPAPALVGPGVLVLNQVSAVSAGTEKMVIDFAKKSLIGKARSRPDQVKQVLDKIKRDGLKATLESVFAKLDQPMALGYSSAGRVLAIDPSVKGIKVGDRVACAGGGYANHADVVYVPKTLAVRIPDSVSYEEAAFSTIGAIALQGLRVADVRVGEKVGVIGLGLIGLLAVQLAKAAGCRVVGSDLDPKKMELAKKLGADEVCPPAALVGKAKAISNGNGLDAVLITAATSSNQPIEAAGEICRLKGRVSIVGAVKIDIPRKVFYEKEITVCVSRSYGPGRYDADYEEKAIDYPIAYVPWTEQRNIECFMDLVAQGKVDVKTLITHRFPIEQADTAYQLISGEKAEPYIGIVLTYPEEEPRDKAIRISSVQPSRAEGKKTVGLAVVGAGNFATQTMLPRLAQLQGAELVAVVDQNGVAAKHAAGKFGFKYATGDLKQVLEDSAVEAVLISTRHNVHAEQAIECLKAGKHVALEKPMCLRPEEIASVVNAVNESGRRFIVGFNRRFAPVAVEAKSHFGKEAKTVNYVVNAGFIPLDHWVHDPQIGGGRIIGEVCHFIDWIQWFTGGQPVEVNAVCVDGKNPGVPDRDNVLITIKLSDGSIGSVLYTAGGDKSFRKEHIEIFGGGKAAVIDEFRTGQVVKSGKPITLAKSGSKGHFEQWQAFVNSIRDGGSTPIPVVESVLSTVATFAAVESLNLSMSVPVPRVVVQD